MPEAIANTGQADPTSIWGSGLLNTLETVGGVAANIISATRGNQPAQKQQTLAAVPAQAAAAATPQTSATGGNIPWVPIGIGGAALLVVLLLVSRKS